MKKHALFPGYRRGLPFSLYFPTAKESWGLKALGNDLDWNTVDWQNLVRHIWSTDWRFLISAQCCFLLIQARWLDHYIHHTERVTYMPQQKAGHNEILVLEIIIITCRRSNLLLFQNVCRLPEKFIWTAKITDYCMAKKSYFWHLFGS